ncbi:MAG: PAS domain-containing protein [Desulfobacteraceae bacterium]|nr:PAS domain-containing protein [Desulfobacteraceae bacterium]
MATHQVHKQVHKEELLIKENDELRERLEESEAVIDAIRKGTVDAVVVYHPSEQVYTLKGADYSYRVLIEAISEGALVISAGGLIAYCNSRFAEMLNTTARDLTGSSLSHCMGPGDLSVFEKLLHSGIAGGAKGEITLRTESGNLLPTHFSISPLLMGDFRGACAVVTDLTEQKLIEEELRRHRSELELLVDERTEELRKANDELERRVSERTSELVLANAQLNREILERQQSQAALQMERDNFRKLSQEFHALLNAISDTLVLLSPGMEVLWTNRGNAHQFYDPLSETVKQYCYELLDDLSAPAADSPVRRCFDTGEKEVAVVTRNGAVLDLRAFPIKEDGRVSRALLLVSDITEKMALQAEAMQACHLATLGELAAGIAHEINNPIMGIINYGQILINECGAESMENDIGKRIVKEGERIGRIVKTLLSYARDDEREKKRAAFISAILEESIILTQAQMRKEGVDLKIKLLDSLPEVDVNFQQIQQIFINIISNARYALNEKYPGRHRNKLLEITGEKVIIGDRPYVRIVFHDQGVGISPHELTMLTKAFFSTKPFGKGTGLGLNITEKIITDHGGFLSFESIQGEFTKVMVDLPVKVNDECQDSCN